MRRVGLCLAATLVLGVSLEGSALTSPTQMTDDTFINFDGLPGGACNLCGPSITNQYAPQGVTFQNPSFPGDDTLDTNLSPYIPDTSGNLLFVYQGGSVGSDPAMPFEILFSEPVEMAGFYFGSSTNAYLELDAYGLENQLIESLTFVGSPAPIGLAGYAGVDESVPVARLDVSYHLISDPSRTLNLSIDGLGFQTSSTPEPSTFALMGAGILALVLRRRRSR